jgi:hypothetical protein
MQAVLKSQKAALQSNLCQIRNTKVDRSSLLNTPFVLHFSKLTLDIVVTPSLLEFSQNIRFSKHEHLLVAQLHFGTSIFGQQDLVSDRQSGGVQGPSDITFSRSHGHDFSFVGVLGGIGGQVKPTGSLDLFGGTLDQDAVSEGLQFAKEGLLCVLLLLILQQKCGDFSPL